MSCKSTIGEYERVSAKWFAETRKRVRDFGACDLSVFVAIVATVALRNWAYFVYATQLIMIAMVLYRLSVTRQPFHNLLYLVAYGSFACWCGLSSFWSIDPSAVFQAIFGIVQFVILGFFVVIYAASRERVLFVLRSLAWSGVVLVVVLVACTPLQDWASATVISTSVASSSNRLGLSVGYHPNALGHICALCILIWMYEFKERRLPRWLCSVSIAALLVVLLFTKSRGSLLFLAVAVLAFVLLMARGGGFLLFSFAVMLLVGIVLAWAVFNIPLLYSLIGFRIEGALGSSASGSLDSSTTVRLNMIAIGLDMFSENPIAGVGFDNYGYHYYYDYSGHRAVYSHSNIIEMLADLGIVGFTFYYLVPFWTVGSLATTLPKSSDRGLNGFFTVLVVAQMLSELITISYTNDLVQLLYALAFAYAVYERAGSRCKIRMQLWQ